MQAEEKNIGITNSVIIFLIRRNSMHQEQPNERTIFEEKESFGYLLSKLATSSAGLVRDEIDLAKQEITEKIKSLRSGAVAAILGALLGLIALLTLDAAFVIGVGKVIGYGWSALIIGGGEAIAAGILAVIGIGQIKKTNLKPEATIRTLKEDREWLKRKVS
jgi:uncharacterized membrane protein YqjE